MNRITASSIGLVLALGVAVPAVAQAGGCEVLQDLRDRAECVARQEARQAARAEVERQLDAARPAREPRERQSAAWEGALDEADAFDPGALLEPRPLAAVGGLAWFLLALRARRRTRERA
jgi:hypothetical protein